MTLQSCITYNIALKIYIVFGKIRLQLSPFMNLTQIMAYDSYFRFDDGNEMKYTYSQNHE